MRQPISLDYDDRTIHAELKPKGWILDSGATDHLLGNCDHFSTFNKVNGIVIGMAESGRTIQATGQGNDTIRSQERIITLENVYYVPDPRIIRNVISQGKLDHRGLTIDTKQGVPLIKNDGRIVGKARLSQGLYHLDLEVVARETHMLGAKPDNSLTLWHPRLGHLNVQDVKKLANGMAEGINFKHGHREEFCETCAVEKAKRLPFHDKILYGITLGDVIHIDACRPFPRSLDGYIGFSVIKDRATGYIRVNLLKQRSEELKNIKNFFQELLTQTGKRIKKLLCVGEYRSDAFKDWAASVGLKVDYTAPHTAEQNGQVERENQMQQDMAMAMRKSAGLKDGYWSYAILAAAMDAQNATVPRLYMKNGQGGSLASDICVHLAASVMPRFPRRHAPKDNPKASSAFY